MCNYDNSCIIINMEWHIHKTMYIMFSISNTETESVVNLQHLVCSKVQKVSNILTHYYWSPHNITPIVVTGKLIYIHNYYIM